MSSTGIFQKLKKALLGGEDKPQATPVSKPGNNGAGATRQPQYSAVRSPVPQAVWWPRLRDKN